MKLEWTVDHHDDVVSIDDSHLTRPEELRQAIVAQRPRGLQIVSDRSGRAPVLHFLKGLDFLRTLRFCGGITSADSRTLESMHDLEELSVDLMPESLQDGSLSFHIKEFSGLAGLRQYGGGWFEGQQTGRERLTNLTSLCLDPMITSTSSLEGLPNAPALNWLGVHFGDIISMRSSYRYPRLSHISLFRCRKLVSLEGLAGLHGDRVDRFEVEGCTKLKDYSELASCTTLRCLNIERCGSIADLGFLKDMQHLERLIIWNTVIEDGDLSPLFGLKSLRMCSLSYKPHYSHGRTEIRRAFPDH